MYSSSLISFLVLRHAKEISCQYTWHASTFTHCGILNIAYLTTLDLKYKLGCNIGIQMRHEAIWPPPPSLKKIWKVHHVSGCGTHQYWNIFIRCNICMYKCQYMTEICICVEITQKKKGRHVKNLVTWHLGSHTLIASRMTRDKDTFCQVYFLPQSTCGKDCICTLELIYV